MLDTANFETEVRDAMRREDVDSISTLVILGSGLSACFADGELAMIDTHGREQTAGHPGRLGLLINAADGTLVAIGRRHFYEGAGFEEITHIVRIAAGLGARRLVVTNAAGGLDPRLAVGDIMMIEGVIGGLVARRLGSGLTLASGAGEAVDREENDRIIERALAGGVHLNRGTYAAVTGPSYETRAEIRMLRIIGADAVGMSTLPEMIFARASGMSVVGLSLITNVASDTIATTLDHDHVLAGGRESARSMRVAIDAARAVGRVK